MSKPEPDNDNASLFERTLEGGIFASRWLQAPLYVGLIIAQCVYVCQFMRELVHLFHTFLEPGKVDDVSMHIMVGVLGLIDVVMVANLVIMVVIGGSETFVSRLHLEGHPDQPEWLSHVNASVLKVKLATAIIGISSIHLLKTFINAASYDEKTLMWQTIIHVTFLLSAMAIAYTDRLTTHSNPSH